MAQQKPLNGIHILDLTRVLAGPFATQMLFDLGAEVIKIENPAHGDDSRLFAPFKDDKSLYFESVNGGKKSLTLNLKNPKAVAILKTLIQKADVLVENFRPGIMAKFGLDYENVKLLNPKLIYASISGYGQTGPDRLKPSYDILAQARGGIMSLTGYPDGDPMMIGVSFSDMIAGVFAVTAITTALYQREKTQTGQQIDISMLDCQVALLESAMMRYQATKVPPKAVGCRHATETPFQSFKASDKHFVLAAIAGEAMFQRLCNAIGHPEIAQDSRFNTINARHEHVEELGAALQNVFQTKTANEWIELLDKNSIPVSPIQNLEDICHDPQVLERNMLLNTTTKGLEDIKIPACPIKMSSLPQDNTYRVGAPALGQNTNEILINLGIDPDQIELLKKEGVI